MIELAKTLYEKFFMRDALGKVTPGFIAILALVHASGIEPVDLMADVPAEDPWLLVVYVPIIPACYLVGLGLQTVGEYLALHSANPRP